MTLKADWASHPAQRKIKVARWLPSRQVIFGSYAQQSNRIEVWQLHQTVDTPAKPICSAAIDSDVMDIACNRDGVSVVGLGSGSLLVGRLADQSWSKIRTVQPHKHAVSALCTLDRRFDCGLGSVGEDGQLHVMAVETGAAVFQQKVSAGSLRAASFMTPSTLVVGGMSKQLSLWDIRQQASRAAPLTSSLSGSEITSLLAIPELSSVIAGGIDGVISVWDIRYGRSEPPTLDCMSASGRHAVASAIWSLSSLPVQSGLVFSCGQDGRLVLTDTRLLDEDTPMDDDTSLELLAPLNSVDVRPDSVSDVVLATDACSLVQVRLMS